MVSAIFTNMFLYCTVNISANSANKWHTFMTPFLTSPFLPSLTFVYPSPHELYFPLYLYLSRSHHYPVKGDPIYKLHLTYSPPVWILKLYSGAASTFKISVGHPANAEKKKILKTHAMYRSASFLIMVFKVHWTDGGKEWVAQFSRLLHLLLYL